MRSFCAGSRLALYGHIFAAAIIVLVATAQACDFPVEDEDVYEDVVAYHAAAKKGDAGMDYGTHDTWEFGHWRYSAKLKSALLDILYDSRLHPAYIVPAMNDLAYEPGGLQPFLHELRMKQGLGRYGLIMALFEHDQKSLSERAVYRQFSFFPSRDLIDGPANIRDKPNGKVIASLPDNTMVSVLRQQGDWMQILTDQARGWTHRNNLLGQMITRIDSDGFTPLTRAAFFGYLETVSFLYQKGADINSVDQCGRTALHWAVKGGISQMGGIEVAMVKKLLSTPNVDLNKKDNKGLTPLSLAVQVGRLDIVNILLSKQSIDMNAVDHEGRTPLMLAVEHWSSKPEIAAALLSSNAIKIDAVDAEGRTALYHAVHEGYPAMVQFLLDRHARTDTVTAKGQSLFHAAIESGHYWGPNTNGLKILVTLKEIDINQADAHGETPLSLAIKKKNMELFQLLMTRKDLDVNKLVRGESYLNLALYSRSDMAELLLDHDDINVNIPNSNGTTAVHMSWYNIGWGEHGVALAKKILARNPELNVENKDGETPLNYNITQNHPDMVRLLVQAKGIDLNRLNGRREQTPLQLAKRFSNSEIISMLENAGAQNFMLIGDADKSPEGIPQALLKNEKAEQAIRFYRGYLVDTFTTMLKYLGQGKPETAVQMQEFVLDEIIVEEGNSMPKYSAEQRKMVRDTFAFIRDYYKRSPRATSAWFKALTEEKKANYEKVDAMLTVVLKGNYDVLPEGELVNHAPTVPILILRKYMAERSIAALDLLRKSKVDEAGQLLKDAIDREDPSKWKSPEHSIVTDPR